MEYEGSMNSVQDVMTKKVISCLPTERLSEVQNLMVEQRVGRILVVDSNKEDVGIISEKDLVNFLIGDKSRRGLEHTRAEDAMSRELITVKAAAPVAEAAKTMIREKVSSLVVKDGQVEGIVTKSDLVMYLAALATTSIDFTVRDFMTANPITMIASQPTFLAAELMSQHRISKVVVVDQVHCPIGIITVTDLAIASSLVRQTGLAAEGKPQFAQEGKYATSIRRLTARDIMTINPICVNQNADLTSSAKLMTRHGISGLPVIENSRKLVGIITKSDLTRAVALQSK
jgi:CBS domain-containing protein